MLAAALAWSISRVASDMVGFGTVILGKGHATSSATSTGATVDGRLLGALFDCKHPPHESELLAGWSPLSAGAATRSTDGEALLLRRGGVLTRIRRTDGSGAAAAAAAGGAGAAELADPAAVSDHTPWSSKSRLAWRTASCHRASCNSRVYPLPSSMPLKCETKESM